MRQAHTQPPARWLVLGFATAFVVMLTAMSGTASARDRNHDKIPDKWEKRHHLSLRVNQANRDQDSDQMPNMGEYQAGMDPRDADSDGDGISDGEENAGEVESFATGAAEGTGTLVITLYAGGTLTGEVGERTRIVCPRTEDENMPDAPAATSSRLGPSAPSQSGPTGPRPPGFGAAAEESSGGGCSHGQQCSVDDLVAGTVIHEADLNVSASGNTFRLIALGTAGAS